MLKDKSVDVAAEVPKDEPPTVYAWFCLYIILFISVGNQWQRYTIGYANSVGKQDDYSDDAKFSI